MFVLYEGLLYLAFLASLPFFLLAGLVRGKYLGSFRERFGRYRTPPAPHDLWIHAVSVGETLAARPIVSGLLSRRPELRIVITTTTSAGQGLARRIFPQIDHAYFPFDFSAAVKRFLAHHRPRLFATMETEIWPNVTRLAAAQGIPLVLVNGRLSDRSFPRYRKARWLLRTILSRYTAFLAREEEDARRYEAIGAPPEKIEVVGNVKFDFDPSLETTFAEVKVTQMARGRHVFVLGSTVEGEDEILTPLLPRLIASTGCFLVIAPRRPERFAVVASRLERLGIRFVRRSSLRQESEPEETDLLLLDSIGELASVYRSGAVAFVGGSLVPHGGHNPVEPAALGIPVAFGPSMSNFREIADLFLREGAAVEVRSGEALMDFARRMLTNPEQQKELGARAARLVQRNRGASERTVHKLLELLP